MTASGRAARILVIEDRLEIRDLVRRALREAGFEATEAADGESGLVAALEQAPDLIVLDLGLPGRDGLEVARDLRARGVRVPLLMLTARVRVAERVEGLDAGADDYLVKPFDVDELVARVRALLRRAALRADDVRLRIGDLVVDPLAREASRGERRLSLTQREYALLECLARHAGRPLTREQIAAQAWRAVQEPTGNVVDVYVSYLRAKLHAPGERELLHTVRGVGYVLRDGDTADDSTSAA
jgi:two-component system, OmpR family, response regulator MprA